jgi:hypothetical protein
MKCVACGSAALVKGEILETGSGSKVQFKPADVSTLKSIFGIGYLPIRASGCTHCGHLQFSVEFTEDILKKYQTFEGQQPGVLERINREG